jgi:hypothetical protein
MRPIAFRHIVGNMNVLQYLIQNLRIKVERRIVRLKPLVQPDAFSGPRSEETVLPQQRLARGIGQHDVSGFGQHDVSGFVYLLTEKRCLAVVEERGIIKEAKPDMFSAPRHFPRGNRATEMEIPPGRRSSVHPYGPPVV